MKKEDIEMFILNELFIQFSKLGFKINKKSNSLIRTFKQGMDRISIGISDYEPNFYLQFSFGKKNNFIYNTIQSAINDKIKNKEIEFFYDKDEKTDLTNIRIAGKEDIKSVLIKVQSFIFKSILPKFEDYNDINYLDDEFNKNNKNLVNLTYWQNIIIAKLANNPEYENLVEKYRKQLEEVADNIHYKAYLPIYEKVVEHLKSIQ